VTHRAWLTSRKPEAPEALVRCVVELFEAHPEWDALDRVEAFAQASELLLRRVLAGGAVARAVALDLLAADSCITWAFEAAADDPETLSDKAEAVKTRIASISREYAA
jgi:hypothetical protein